MHTDAFKKYAELTAAIAVMEEQKAAIAAEVLAEMTEAEHDKCVTEHGTFSRARRTTWKYTEAVKKMEAKVRAAKIAEEESGEAKAAETVYLRFQQ